MSQRRISTLNGHSPQKMQKRGLTVTKSKRMREESLDLDDQHRKHRSSSSSSSSQSSSSSSGSSDDDDNNKHDRKKKSQKKEQQKMQARKSIYLQQEKLKDLQQKEIQEKRKMIMIKSQKKIEMQEDVIDTLQNQLQQQKQNVDQLKQQKEQLKAETEKIQTIEQEKNIVKSNFEAQKSRIQNVKKTFMKRQQTLVDVKADNFNKALNKDKSKIREVGNTIRYFIGQIFFSISNHYLLSKFVYKIANSSGPKSEGYFSKNAFFFNNYLVSLFIFLPFFIAFFSHTEITGMDSFFLHNYSNSIRPYVSFTLAFFFLFQLIIGVYKYNDVKKKEVDQEAKKKQRMINFKIVFGDWNWKIRERDSMKKNQFALTKRVKQYFSARDVHYKKYYDENAGTLQKIFFRFIAIALIIASTVPVIILHEREIFLDLVDVKLISETINGVFIACISKFVCFIIIPLNKFEGLANQNSRMSALYFKKFFAEIVPILASILMSYSIMIDDESLKFHIGELTNDIKLDTDHFVCREHQTAFQMVGLLFGYFLINFVYQYLPSFVNSVINKSSSSIYDKEIQFDVIDASIPLLVLNTIFLSLLPFTFFAIFIFVFLLCLNFFNEWFIQIKVRLPQYSGLSATHIKGSVSFFYNITLLFCFCYYSFFYNKIFTPVYHIDNPSILCNPFMGQNISLTTRLRNYFYKTEVIGVIYDIMTWLPLVYGLFIIFLVAYFVSLNQKIIWEAQFQKKIKELGGIKVYYEQRIERLEKRIEAANKYLSADISDSDEQDDDYNLNDKQKKVNDTRLSQSKNDMMAQRRGTKTSIKLADPQDTSLKMGSHSRLPKGGSISSTVIPQSTKYINQYLTTEVKENDLSSKEDLSDDIKQRRNFKNRNRNFF